MRIEPRLRGLPHARRYFDRWLAGFCALSVALCLFTGCPGTLDDKESFLRYPNGLAGAGGGAGVPVTASGGGPADCGDVVARVLTPNCGGSGCHGDVAPQQDLDLVSPGVASRVVGVSGKICTSVLADPMNPESSLIYQKLATNPACGAQMPLARPPLSTADAACLLAWIAAQ